MGSTTRAGRAGDRTKLRRHPLTLACATALLLAAGAVNAADTVDAAAAAAATADKPADAAAADATEAEKDKTKELKSVKVVGIRRGIEDAIDTKKSSTSIVESISAEDIGKLPDVSIAESISRLPGLSAQRVAGRAQVISVRGLSPDFSTTLLNGRELVSTGDNRSVEFDQYPSELMAGVTVYKTPDAGLVGQGLSGTINMKTVRPLDFAEPVFVISGRLSHNSLGSAANSDADGNRFNASWITQNSDRTVGFAIGYSHSDTPVQENQVGLYEPWEEIGPTWRPGVPSGAGCPASHTNCTYYSEGIKALRRTGYTKRDGVMATLQFRPSDKWTSTFDVFASRATQEDTANQFEVNLGDYNGTGTHILVTNPVINDNLTFVGGDAHNLYPLVRGMYNKRKDKINAFGWNNEFSWGPATVVADISWSKATRDELNLENNTQLYPFPQLDTVHLAYDSNDFSQLTPDMDYSDPSKLFLANTIYGSGYGKTPNVKDELKSFKLEANLPTSSDSAFFSSFDFGVNYADREKEKHQPEAPILLGPQGVTPIDSQFQYGLVDLGFAGVGMIPSWNVPAAVAKYMTFDPNEDADFLVAKAWKVDETITSAWFKANVDTTWGSVPVRGNFGLQLQHTDQSSTANVFDHSKPAGEEIVEFTNGKTYNDWLPSMNLAFSLTDDQVLRVALARQVARARVDQLRASLDFGVDTATGKPGASGGNPLLDPWRANAFDISWEHYFQGTKGYVAAAYFYKKLTSYIFTQTQDGYDFSDLVASYVPPPGGHPALNEGTLTGPFNGQGGKLSGIELTASIPFELFSESLQGFGVIANASFNDSNIQIRDPDSASSVGGGDIDLPGLSKHVYNFTAYYEHNGFEVRFNQRRRSDFIGEIGDFAANRKLRYVEGENITDGQISYNFDEGSSLHGLSLLLQGTNLTNAHYRTYAGSKDRPLENIEWGRTILLGASYKF
jgi:TonB-dependent receptor